MKNILLGIFFFAAFLSQTYAQELCPVKNHVFFIHGIGGSAGTFGSFPQYLAKFYPCMRPKTFEYDTGNNALSTYDFTQHFDQYLTSLISKGEVTPQDRLSFVMHSQGGIIGNIWVNMIKEVNPALYQQIDSFITLATPHWGADMAEWGRNLLHTLPPGVPMLKFGKVELNDMAFGSGTIREFTWNFAKTFDPGNVRFLSVGGIHEKFGEVKGEDDGVVPLYSARPDLYVTHLNVDMKIPEGGIPAATFKKTSRAPFVIVPATHITLSMQGIANVPKSCVENRDCKHPSLEVIMDHLTGKKKITSTERFLTQFRGNIFVNNLTGEKISQRDVSISISTPRDVEVPIAQRLNGYRGKSQLAEGMAFSFLGSTPYEGAQKVKIKFKIQNRISRVIEMPVEAGYSSFITLNLTR